MAKISVQVVRVESATSVLVAFPNSEETEKVRIRNIVCANSVYKSPYQYHVYEAMRKAFAGKVVELTSCVELQPNVFVADCMKIAQFSLKHGFARVKGYAAANNQVPQELLDAELEAQQGNLGVWSNFVNNPKCTIHEVPSNGNAMQFLKDNGLRPDVNYSAVIENFHKGLHCTVIVDPTDQQQQQQQQQQQKKDNQEQSAEKVASDVYRLKIRLTNVKAKKVPLLQDKLYRNHVQYDSKLRIDGQVDDEYLLGTVFVNNCVSLQEQLLASGYAQYEPANAIEIPENSKLKAHLVEKAQPNHHQQQKQQQRGKGEKREKRGNRKQKAKMSDKAYKAKQGKGSNKPNKQNK